MAGRTSRSKVDWYGQDVLVRVNDASDALIAAIAHQIESRAKANIVDNDQIDTGFMLNSTYARTLDDSTYAQAKAAARSKNPDAEMGPEPQLGTARAVVGVGASYAVYQELDQSFLYRAVEDVQGEVAEMEIQTVARESGLAD